VGRIHRPSPAMVVASLALLIALGGTSVAAVDQLRRNSVGTLQLKNNAVTAPKIASNAVIATKIRSGAVTNAKIAADAVTSAKIADGTVTATDLAAPTDAFVRFLNGPVAVPAALTTLANLAISQSGSYLLTAKAYVTGGGVVTCRLEAGSDFDSSQATPLLVAPQTISNIVGHTFTAAGSVDFRCSGTGDAAANFIKIAAVRVANLTNTG
jgi:hypothetical protein